MKIWIYLPGIPPAIRAVVDFQSEITWYAEYKNGVVDIGGDKLPPRLITLIGRFYEAQEEADNELESD